MKTKSLHFRVGLLACGTLTVFVGLVLFIVGSAFDVVTARYYIQFDENVKGMVVGSKVNFQGVPIGAVTDIRFRDGRTEVEVSVDPRKAVIQTVTRARLDRLLVTGQVTVELEGYAPGASKLVDGARIQPKDDPLNSLKSSLPELMQRLEGTLARVDRLVNSGNQLLGRENLERVAKILENVESASQRLPDELVELAAAVKHEVRSLPVLLDGTQQAVERLVSVAEAGSNLLDGPDTRAIVASAKEAMERLVRLEAKLEVLTREATAMLVGSRFPLESVLLTARESLREFGGLARTLRLAPSALLFGEERAEIEIPARPAGGGR